MPEMAKTPGGAELDETRFDTSTRRRFGLAVGGAAASVLGLLGAIGLSDDDASAADRNDRDRNNDRDRRRRRRRRRNQCQKLGQTCDETRRRQRCCNDTQLCAQVPDLGTGTFCCKQLSQSCRDNTDCCGRNRCRSGICQTS